MDGVFSVFPLDVLERTTRFKNQEHIHRSYIHARKSILFISPSYHHQEKHLLKYFIFFLINFQKGAKNIQGIQIVLLKLNICICVHTQRKTLKIFRGKTESVLHLYRPPTIIFSIMRCNLYITFVFC